MPDSHVGESRALVALRALHREDTFDVIDLLERRADKFTKKAEKPHTEISVTADLRARANAFRVIADFLRETRR